MSRRLGVLGPRPPHRNPQMRISSDSKYVKTMIILSPSFDIFLMGLPLWCRLDGIDGIFRLRNSRTTKLVLGPFLKPVSPPFSLERQG